MLNKFNESAVSIAKAITETSQSATSMDRATQTPGFTDILKGIGRAALSAGKGAGKKGGGNAGAPPGKARGGIQGSKDDGSGDATKSPAGNSLEGKGFDSLEDAKENLSRPLELKNMPTPPSSEPYDMKEFDTKATANINKKSGSIDDFDVRYSDKEGPKQQRTLAELKAEWNKPVLSSDVVTQEVAANTTLEKQRPVSAPSSATQKVGVEENTLVNKSLPPAQE